MYKSNESIGFQCLRAKWYSLMARQCMDPLCPICDGVHINDNEVLSLENYNVNYKQSVPHPLARKLKNFRLSCLLCLSIPLTHVAARQHGIHLSAHTNNM